MADLITVLSASGVARLTLNRAERHNAFDDALVAALNEALAAWSSDPRVRVLVLDANGPSFSAGADLDWMRRTVDYSEAENLQDARALARLLQQLDEFPAPTLALVQGSAYGGGVGLVAACDVALAVETARFALTEVRLGLVPAVISPYVMAAMGARACRRYMLSAEVFDARAGLSLGLLHEVVGGGELAAAGERVIDALLAAAPDAQRIAKRLIARVAGESGAAGRAVQREELAQLIAALRVSQEGQEGLAAFLARRAPRWAGKGSS